MRENLLALLIFFFLIFFSLLVVWENPTYACFAVVVVVFCFCLLMLLFVCFVFCLFLSVCQVPPPLLFCLTSEYVPNSLHSKLHFLASKFCELCFPWTVFSLQGKELSLMSTIEGWNRRAGQCDLQLYRDTFQPTRACTAACGTIRKVLLIINTATCHIDPWAFLEPEKLWSPV